MKKKPIILVIILIFLFSSIIPIVSSDEISNDDIIYVDDDNINGPWDGSEEYPYLTIYDGINVSTDDDTVMVLNGIYHDFEIHIDTSIHLKGEDKKNTIIEEGQIIWMTSSNSVISGFNLSRCNIYSENQDYVEIYDNNIIGGIIIDNSIDSYIHNNTITCLDEFEPGIKIIDGCRAIIEYNIISNIIEGGIAIFGNANIISNNTISNDNDVEGYGIYLQGHNNIIEDNEIAKCFFGIKISYAYGNMIKRNNFIDNTVQVYSFGAIDAMGKPKNLWDYNFWDRPRISPKCLFDLDIIPIPGGRVILFFGFRFSLLGLIGTLQKNHMI